MCKECVSPAESHVWGGQVLGLFSDDYCRLCAADNTHTPLKVSFVEHSLTLLRQPHTTR